MSYSFVRASSQSMWYTGLTSFDYSGAFSVALWWNQSSTNTTQKVAIHASDDLSNTNWGFDLKNDNAVSGRVQIVVETNPGQKYALYDGNTETNQWVHWGFSDPASSLVYADISAYKNGVLQSQDGGADGSTDKGDVADGMVIGGAPSAGSVIDQWDGLLAEAAVWTRELSAAEFAALANGYSPLFFPDGLLHYFPLIRDTRERKSGVSPTLNNTPTVAAHPPIIYPARFTITADVAAGGGPSTPRGLSWISRGFNPQRSTSLNGELQ